MSIGVDVAAACHVVGCNAPPRRRGLCRSHYKRLLAFGDPSGGLPVRAAPNSLLKYITEVAVPYQGENCLTWPFSTRAHGYGQIAYQGKNWVASRLVCEMAQGSPPEPSYQAAHSCGNGHLGCVNPNHISWKTPKDNLADKAIHGTIQTGERNGAAKLTASDVSSIRRLHGKVPRREIAEMFGCSAANISSIVRRLNWTHLPDETGEPIDEDRAASAADASYQFRMEQA